MSSGSRWRRKPAARSRFSEPCFIFCFPLLLPFLGLCSGSNMDMKKRISLELRDRNPAEVCNVKQRGLSFLLSRDRSGMRTGAKWR